MQGDDDHLAEVTIGESILLEAFAAKFRALVEAVAAGERPFLDEW